MSSARWQTARRLLCVRLDALGDVLTTTPALAALKHAVPDRRLTLLTSSAGGQLAGLLPDVDDWIMYESPWMKATPLRDDAAVDLEIIGRLRNSRFDGAVIFTVFSQNPLPAALLCYLAGIPLRLGHCRENPYQLLTDWVQEIEPEKLVRHEVERQLDLVAAVDCHTADRRLRMAIPPAATRTVRTMLDHCGLDRSQRWLVVHPGGSAPSRRYPPELYAQVASSLSETHGLQLVFTGIEEERRIVDEVRFGVPLSVSLVGRLGVAELSALLAIAPLLLTNNTGPAHIAAAFGTPVVDLYALTNPQHTPWRTPHRVLSYDVSCKNCYRSVCPRGHHRCLRNVKPIAVVDAVLDLLSETTRAKASAEANRPRRACSSLAETTTR